MNHKTKQTHYNNLGGGNNLTLPIATPSKVIPVLVHIVREGNSTSNEPTISYAQVESQIDALNAYFSGQGTGNVNSHIQFCLVKNNFNNLASNWSATEPGVLRYTNATHANTTANATQANALASFTNTAPYGNVLNIWVVKSINGNCGGLLGYCPLPILNLANQNNGFLLDGIVIQAKVFGSNTIPTTATYPLLPNYPPCTNLLLNFNQGKTLAHEVGHYLSVWHTFQNQLNSNNTCVGAGSNLDGDFCSDTDPCNIPQGTTTYINGAPIPATCGNTADDVHNFMYSLTSLLKHILALDKLIEWMLF